MDTYTKRKFGKIDDIISNRAKRAIIAQKRVWEQGNKRDAYLYKKAMKCDIQWTAKRHQMELAWITGIARGI